MKRALARIVNKVVDDNAAHAALEERVAFVIVRMQIAIDEDVRNIVVNE